jgi:hypothetical protein
MSEMDGKKTEAFTVKCSTSMHDFVVARAKQGGFESPPEYIRSLLEAEHKKALHDFNLLSQALGIKDSVGILGNVNFLHRAASE